MACAALVALAHADIVPVDQRLRMRMEMIGEFEVKAENAENEESRKRAEAMVKVLYLELKSDFRLKDLINQALLQVGDYLRIHTVAPRDALPYYEELLTRQDQTYLFHALLGRAAVYGLSPDAKDMDRSIADLARIYKDSPDKEQRENALFRKIEVLMKKKDYATAADQAILYLDRDKNDFAKYAPQVRLMLAQSFDMRNMTEDAIAMYVKIWSVHMSNLRISNPAFSRWMELLWARNKPGDRQAVYAKGVIFLDLTSRFKDKFTKEELGMFEGVERLVRIYEADPKIKKILSMEEIRRSRQKK